MTAPSRLIPCPACKRMHLPESMVTDPDRPPGLLCPATWRGLRLTPHERAEANRLLQSAFAPEHGQ